MKNYIEKLAKQNDLHVVEREVDPCHQLAAIAKLSQQRDDKPILFKNVKGSNFPVVGNLYNSRRFLCDLINAGDQPFCGAWNMLLDNITNDVCRTTEAQPEFTSGKLSELPLITYHGKDAGPYFTSAIYLAKSPRTGVRNLSFHRSMYVSDNELRVRLGTSHDLAKYQREAEEDGQPLEAALLIGVEPEVFLAAATSIPPDKDELALAATIKGEPIKTCPARTLDLDIPCSAQFVVEGRFLPNIKRDEGPFGEFLGYYVPVGENHVFEVSAVYWQQQPVFHSILCGSNDDLVVLESVTAGKVYRHLNNVLPGIIDVSCSPAFMNTTIKIRQQYEGHARQVLLAAFGVDLDYNKACFVVDEDIDITDMNEVIWAYLTRGRVDQRTMILPDVPGFYRDPHKDHWGRIGIDATAPFGRLEEFERKAVPNLADINLSDYIID